MAAVTHSRSVPPERLPLERLPRVAARLEGVFVFGAAVSLYIHLGYGWVPLMVLALAPDLSMLGYLGGNRIGALSYDVAHAYVGPLLLASVGAFEDIDLAVQFALIWGAHIGADRALGYGLKYPTGFKQTHLQRL
jgi:Domain of unknown function (DUF4260)